MSKTQAKVGQTYYSGNTTDPSIGRVQSVAPDGTVTVEHLGREKSGTYGAGMTHTVPADVFSHCYFLTWDDMFALYEANRAPVYGMPGARLPGD